MKKLLLLGVLFGWVAIQAADMSDVVCNRRDEIKAQVGQVFTYQTPAVQGGSTGYSQWQFKAECHDGRCSKEPLLAYQGMSLSDLKSTEQPKLSGAIGGPRIGGVSQAATFSFKALKPGKTSIIFVQYGPTKKAEHMCVSVDVVDVVEAVGLGASVDTVVGTIFPVELPATIPGTTWQLSSAPQAVQQIGEPQIGKRDIPGVGGPSVIKKYTFKAVKPGFETLYFKKIAPGGKPLQESFSLNVTVR